MKNKASNANVVLTFGLIGILAVLLTIISDFILIGTPVGAYSFLKLGTESMANITQWRITAGSFIGIIVLPFQIAGLYSMYYGLRTSGRVMPWLVSIVNVHALIMGVAFHISYVYIGCGWKLYHKMGTGNKIGVDLISKFDFYWKILLVIMFTELLVSSVIYIVLIMKGKTLYPKWMAVLNPLCVLLFLFPLVLILPAPIGGYVTPAYLNISTLVFFSLSTGVIYKRLKKQEVI